MNKLTYTEWKLLKNIYLSCARENIILGHLAKRIGINQCSPMYRKILNILLTNNIAVIERYDNISKIIIINQQRLFDFIDDSTIYKEFADYIHKTRSLYIDI